MNRCQVPFLACLLSQRLTEKHISAQSKLSCRIRMGATIDHMMNDFSHDRSPFLFSPIFALLKKSISRAFGCFWDLPGTFGSSWNRFQLLGNGFGCLQHCRSGHVVCLGSRSVCPGSRSVCLGNNSVCPGNTKIIEILLQK